MNRLIEMEAFANVIDQGGFTDAARKMGISKSAVSKHVTSLENRLGARLLHRTTRSAPLISGLRITIAPAGFLAMQAMQTLSSSPCRTNQQVFCD